MRYLSPAFLLFSAIIFCGASRRRTGTSLDDEAVMWLIAIIAGIVVVVLLINALQGSRARAEAKERIERAKKEALKFFGDLERRKKLTIIPVDIVLKKGEVGILQESSSLHETRSFRVYGGVVHALRGYMLAAAPPSRTSD